MSSRTADLHTTPPSPAGNAPGFSRPNPVCTEIGVSVQGSAHTPAGGQASQPFLEQTSTVIVFEQGAVVRLSESVTPGQILILRHLRTNEESACRVVSVKTNPNVKGYVELEFLQPSPNFWEMQFPAASGTKTPSVGVARPVPLVAPHRRESDSSPIPEEQSVSPNRAEQVPSQRPKAAVPRSVSPAPGPRYTPPPSEEGTGITGPGLSFLPDLLDTLVATAESKQRAPEAAARPETTRAATSAPAKPPVAPWVAAPATPRTDVTKGISPASDGRYVSDLLDTLTPIGESILREKPKSAASASLPLATPHAPVIAKPSFAAPTVARPVAGTHLEPVVTETASPSHATQHAHAAPHAHLSVNSATIAPEVAPLMHSDSDVVSHGQPLGGDLAAAGTKRGSPTLMRVLAIAAGVALALAAGAGVYRWEKKSGPSANLAASSQPALTGAAASSASPSPAPAPVAEITTPSVVVSATPEQPAAAKESHAAAQPSANSASAPTSTSTAVAAHAAPAPPAPRGPAVAGMKMSAPNVESHATDQAAPAIAIADDVPNTVETASAAGILGDTRSSGPAAPPPARVSSGAQAPRLLSSAAPIYPYAARAEHVQGDVSVDVLVNELGQVAGMTVNSGPALLRQAALDALRHRKYAPALLDGKPVAAHIVVVIHFQM